MIDAHQHFWRYDRDEYAWIDETMAAIRRDFLPADVRPAMDAAGVSASVAVQARQTLDETRWLLDLAARHPFICGVVGWIDLQGDVEAQLASFAETGPDEGALVGVRHIVQAEPEDFLERPAFLAGIARLERFGLSYDILVYARQLPAAIAFADRFPRQPFVLDHLGKPEVREDGRHDSRHGYKMWRRHLEALAALPNVCCKLSGLVTEADWRAWTPGQLRPYLDAALEAFGPSRVMMGSDWPVCLVAASYAEVTGLVVDAVAEYSAGEREQMLGGNARRFWGLAAPSAERGRGGDAL
jgi:L-fuconolactonase